MRQFKVKEAKGAERCVIGLAIFTILSGEYELRGNRGIVLQQNK
jgi:hypothetical protein